MIWFPCRSVLFYNNSLFVPGFVSYRPNVNTLFPAGVITPNQIPLTTIVTYLHKSYRSRISNHWATIPAVWYLPFIKSPRKHTVTYHFRDLQEVYNGNRQIHTKCQLQYFHPPHISTSGKCHCVIIHQTTKATEYIG